MENQPQQIPIAAIEAKDQVLRINGHYIPDGERILRKSIHGVFGVDDEGGDFGENEMLAEAVFWSLGELINNANKANNRWALLRSALFQKIRGDDTESTEDRILRDVEYAIEHNQTDLLKKYDLENFDLTEAILSLIQNDKTNSFALSEKFGKKIDLTLRLKTRAGKRILITNVINNSPITIVDRERVEYNLERVKEDLMRAGANPFEAAMKLYDKAEDHAGGGFGAGLRSIVLFLKEAYTPFEVEIMYSRLIQYRSTGGATIFTLELPVLAPPARD